MMISKLAGRVPSTLPQPTVAAIESTWFPRDISNQPPAVWIGGKRAPVSLSRVP